MSARPAAGAPRGPLWTAQGTRADHLLEPNPLWASNGVAFGPDQRLYVAQFLGGTVSALDTATGGIDVVIGPDGPLTGPDDLVFGDDGSLFVVDLPAGLVWRRAPDGTLSVVADGIVAPDGIAWHDGRLFVNELTVDGRLLEIDLDGGPPRVMATGLVLGNAMQVGPDGQLYHPHLGGGEIRRIGLDGGTAERVVGGLDRPVAVRFDPRGRLRVLSNADGRLWTIDPDSGSVVSTVETGVVGADNVAFAPDGTAWVSGAFRGGVRAVAPDGTVRVVVPEGLNGPFGIAATRGGTVVADYFGLARVRPDGTPERSGDLLPVVRGGIVGVAVRGARTTLVTDTGAVVAGDPWTGDLHRVADGLTRPTGVADTGDGVLVADTGAGTVVHVADDGSRAERATGLDRPTGVAVAAGRVYVAETGRGRVLRLADGHDGHTVVAAGLQRPEGLAAHGDDLWCAEAGAGRVVRIDAARRTTTVVASGVAFDVHPHHVPPDARSGAARRPAPFAGLTTDSGPDGGALVVAQNARGTLLRLSPRP